MAYTSHYFVYKELLPKAKLFHAKRSGQTFHNDIYFRSPLSPVYPNHYGRGEGGYVFSFVFKKKSVFLRFVSPACEYCENDRDMIAFGNNNSEFDNIIVNNKALFDIKNGLEPDEKSLNLLYDEVYAILRKEVFDNPRKHSVLMPILDLTDLGIADDTGLVYKHNTSTESPYVSFLEDMTFDVMMELYRHVFRVYLDRDNVVGVFSYEPPSHPYYKKESVGSLYSFLENGADIVDLINRKAYLFDPEPEKIEEEYDIDNFMIPTGYSLQDYYFESWLELGGVLRADDVGFYTSMIERVDSYHNLVQYLDEVVSKASPTLYRDIKALVSR